MLGVTLVSANQIWIELSMNPASIRLKKVALTCLALFMPLLFLSGPTSAQTSPKKAESLGAIQQELVRTETGFFEAWKTKDDAYFRAHMLENGIFWGESGAFSRDEQLQLQQAGARVCNVQGYGLSDFGVLPLTEGAYLLTYKAEQYATCNGEKVPVHMNGSSIYIFKAGHWQAIYRAEVPQKNQS
jgi:hypothetical protein